MHISAQYMTLVVVFSGKINTKIFREIQKTNSHGGGRRTWTSHTRQGKYLKAIEMERDFYRHRDRQTINGLAQNPETDPQTYGSLANQIPTSQL